MLRRLIPLPLVLSVLAAACTGGGGQTKNSPAASGIRRGGDLIFAQSVAPPHLQPAETFVNEALWDELLIMEPLFTPSDDDQQALPWLAESANVSDDHLTWTIKLRPNVKFSNGQPLTSADVKFSLEEATKSDAWGFITAPIKDGSVDTPDPLTVEIHTKQPWAPMLADLALFANVILPNNYGNMTKDQFFEKPYGTGPFKIDRWVKGQSLKLVANPFYWQKGKPFLHSVTFLAVPDDTTRVNMLRGGQAQIIEAPPWSTLDTLKAASGLTAVAYPSSRTDLLYLNTKVKPFDDQNVRQAVAYALDRKSMVDAVLFGHGKPANSFIAPGVASYDPNNVAPQYDAAKAKQLLAASSVPNGFKTSLLIPSTADARTIAQIMQANLQAIGINVQIVTQDSNTAFGNLQAGKYQMMAFYWTTDIPHADELIGGYADVDGQWTGLVAPNSRQAIEEARHTFDKQQTDQLYAEVQRQVATDSSVIALFYSDFPYAFSQKVHGFNVLPTLNFHLEDVWLSG